MSQLRQNPHPEDMRLELQDAQFDYRCQLKLNTAFQNELKGEIIRLQLIKGQICEESNYLRNRYYAIERTLCPITKLKPTPSPTSRSKKPLTPQETIDALSKLCGPETAALIEQMMKGGGNA